MPRKISVVIAALLLAAAVSCGRTAQNENQNQPAATQQPSAPAQAEQPPAQQPAQTAEPAQREAAAPAQSTSNRSATGNPSANRAKAPSSPASPTASERPPAEPAPRPAVPSAAGQAAVGAAVTPPPQTQTRWIPSGTTLEVRLLDSLNSSVNKEGDTFQTSLEKDLVVDGRIVVPRGSTILGKVLSVTQPGRVKGRAAMSLALTKLSVGDVSYSIQTNTVSVEAESSTKSDATKVGIGAGLGAIIGAIAGGGKGAAIGAAAGGGAGGAVVLATKGKDVKFDPEQKFNFQLRSDLGIKD